LDTCIKYVLRQSNLKDEILLLYLVGPWKGNATVIINEVSSKADYKVIRDLVVSFESNQAGQIYKGFVQGTEKITIKAKNNATKGNQAKTSTLSGSITGNIVPNSPFNILLKLDKNYPNDNFLKKYNSVELKGKNYIDFPAVVDQKIIDEAFNYTVSNMKIYYNLLFNSEKESIPIIEHRYNQFFNDILSLLYYVNEGYISKQVFEKQSIYNKSEYISSVFESYYGDLINYYNYKIENSVSTRIKIDLYKVLLTEMIQACSFCHLNIVNDDVIHHLDIDLDRPNNIIDRTFYRYYLIGNNYYSKKLNTKLSYEDKKYYKNSYLRFMKEILEITKTGLISSVILKELNINDNALNNIENM